MSKRPKNPNNGRVSNRDRFETFKRDGFTCQYCGRKPPEIALEVDHIHPQAVGGDGKPGNLITSCDQCNNGKRDIPIIEVTPSRTCHNSRIAPVPGVVFFWGLDFTHARRGEITAAVCCPIEKSERYHHSEQPEHALSEGAFDVEFSAIRCAQVLFDLLATPWKSSGAYKRFLTSVGDMAEWGRVPDICAAILLRATSAEHAASVCGDSLSEAECGELRLMHEQFVRSFRNHLNLYQSDDRWRASRHVERGPNAS